MKATRDQLQQSADDANKNNTLLSIVLNCVINGECQIKVRKGEYTARAFRLTGDHGGMLSLTFHPAGQSASTTAHYFEEWRGYVHERRTRSASPDDIALDELRWAIIEKQAALLREESAAINAAAAE